MRFVRLCALFALAAACSSQRTGSGGVPGASATPSTAAAEAGAAPPAASSSAAGAPAPEPQEPRQAEAAPSFDEIATVLFGDRESPSSFGAAACPESLPPDARVRCLFDERYRGDANAASLAHELYVEWRVVAGVEVAHTMDGGYRGMIRIEPALPVGPERRHLEWIVAAMRDFDAFFTQLDQRRAKPNVSGREREPEAAPKRYRFRPIALRFMRSVAARTPSAYAHDWTVAWNLAGSLHTSADAVRETLFHEIFHLNDYAHPPAAGEAEAWSFAALGGTFDAIVKKCGTSIPCLGPYTPNDTIVRGGTYYSFQPGNGVREYAAELALRYYREQRAAFGSAPRGGGKRTKPFKCGPPENARAWALLRDEFFAGVDVVPPCGS